MDVITMMRVIGLQSYGLKKVVSELKEKWKRDIKPDVILKDPERKALNVNNT
jgi:hypothetical protein